MKILLHFEKNCDQILRFMLSANNNLQRTNELSLLMEYGSKLINQKKWTYGNTITNYHVIPYSIFNLRIMCPYLCGEEDQLFCLLNLGGEGRPPGPLHRTRACIQTALPANV